MSNEKLLANERRRNEIFRNQRVNKFEKFVEAAEWLERNERAASDSNQEERVTRCSLADRMAHSL